MEMNKVQERWDKLKKDREPCSNCGSVNIHLNCCLNRKFKRYWLECWRCHFCAKRANTIRGAIRVWNIEYTKRKKAGEVSEKTMATGG